MKLDQNRPKWDNFVKWLDRKGGRERAREREREREKKREWERERERIRGSQIIGYVLTNKDTPLPKISSRIPGGCHFSICHLWLVLENATYFLEDFSRSLWSLFCCWSTSCEDGFTGYCSHENLIQWALFKKCFWSRKGFEESRRSEEVFEESGGIF